MLASDAAVDRRRSRRQCSARPPDLGQASAVRQRKLVAAGFAAWAARARASASGAAGPAASSPWSASISSSAWSWCTGSVAAITAVAPRRTMIAAGVTMPALTSPGGRRRLAGRQDHAARAHRAPTPASRSTVRRRPARSTTAADRRRAGPRARRCGRCRGRPSASSARAGVAAGVLQHRRRGVVGGDAPRLAGAVRQVGPDDHRRRVVGGRRGPGAPMPAATTRLQVWRSSAGSAAQGTNASRGAAVSVQRCTRVAELGARRAAARRARRSRRRCRRPRRARVRARSRRANRISRVTSAIVPSRSARARAVEARDAEHVGAEREEVEVAPVRRAAPAAGGRAAASAPARAATTAAR